MISIDSAGRLGTNGLLHSHWRAQHSTTPSTSGLSMISSPAKILATTMLLALLATIPSSTSSETHTINYCRLNGTTLQPRTGESSCDGSYTTQANTQSHPIPPADRTHRHGAHGVPWPTCSFSDSSHRLEYALLPSAHFGIGGAHIDGTRNDIVKATSACWDAGALPRTALNTTSAAQSPRIHSYDSSTFHRISLPISTAGSFVMPTYKPPINSPPLHF